MPRPVIPILLGPYIGRRVYHLRSVQRLALEDVARKAGVDAQWLAWLEAGQVADPSVSALYGLARALHVRPQTLLPGRLPARRARATVDHTGIVQTISP
jgi:transcriptional regulator with XRE-family HTH domain